MSKNNLERNNKIFALWDSGYSYAQISEMEHPSYLSLSRIRVIIYGGPGRLHNEFEKNVYKIYRMKFLELENVHQAIMFVYENQPTHRLCISSIRQIVNDNLKMNSKKQAK